MIDLQSLQTNSEHPELITILISVSLSIILSALIVLIYDLTTRVSERNFNFLQSLALISILATMVMQAVGDSLARGLGMLGALAIIRFRTALRDPRNMTFMFASLSVGICCGALGFTIAIFGTIAFCVLAVILRFSPFGQQQTLKSEINIKSRDTTSLSQQLITTLKQNASYVKCLSHTINDTTVPLEISYNEHGKKIVVDSEVRRIHRLKYEIKHNAKVDISALMTLLQELEFVEEVSINFEEREHTL